HKGYESGSTEFVSDDTLAVLSICSMISYLDATFRHFAGYSDEHLAIYLYVLPNFSGICFFC
ncbi:hypothetical protein MKW94_020817, partial [Papaver nudicaule]|nr:hypothetical protein [Papaver nudicaule]